MSQFDNLDSAIIELVKTRGPLKFPGLRVGAVEAEAAALAESTGREDFRIIDGRLQILRKRGVLRYDTKHGWSLSTGSKLAIGAFERVSKFLTERAQCRGIDKEQISALNVGDEAREAVLTTTDLQALLTLAQIGRSISARKN